MKRIITTLLALLLIAISAGPMGIAEAEAREIYVPIIEGFSTPEKTSLQDAGITASEDGCNAECVQKPITNCRELFQVIQTYNGGKQETFIKNNDLWKEGKFPECFIIGDSGVNIIENYLGTIYQWLAGIVGSVAVLMIIVGGIQISTGGGDQNNVNEGKTKIIQALSGLAILFLSGLILYTINPTFFGG